jgi:hypothetical protein
MYVCMLVCYSSVTPLYANCSPRTTGDYAYSGHDQTH